jgi:hypothetical protein
VFYLAKKLYRPEFFQGNRRLGKPAQYFEGWYFKVVFPDAPFAFIPGISLARDDPHGFIQVLTADNGPSGESRYHRFPLERFQYDRNNFEIALGNNRFSLTGIDIDLDGFQVQLQIENSVRWPSTLFSPSSMGWYTFMRFMECYHGIIALDADIHGTINGEPHSGGRFYLEKDWGSSFPKAWIWMQSNSFSNRASLSCSVARVPFRGKEFTGFIIGLYTGGKLHSFTTYNEARLTSIEYDDSSVWIVAEREQTLLQIRARREPGVQLASHIKGEMRGRIEETLGSEISVELRQGGKQLFNDRGVHAGLEVVDPALLLQGIISLQAE